MSTMLAHTQIISTAAKTIHPFLLLKHSVLPDRNRCT